MEKVNGQSFEEEKSNLEKIEKLISGLSQELSEIKEKLSAKEKEEESKRLSTPVYVASIEESPVNLGSSEKNTCDGKSPEDSENLENLITEMVKEQAEACSVTKENKNPLGEDIYLGSISDLNRMTDFKTDYGFSPVCFGERGFDIEDEDDSFFEDDDEDDNFLLERPFSDERKDNVSINFIIFYHINFHIV